MQTNREIYDTAAFGDWTTYTNLETHEAFLAKKYFDPLKRTVEAGAGGGRIVLGLQGLGFRDLHAFDYVSQFVEEVRRRDAKREIHLSAQDATRLAYRDESFDQALYLAQLVCLIEGAERKEVRDCVLSEAFRVLRAGGTSIFSFLSHEVRSRSRVYRLYLTYLRGLRELTRARRDLQTLPWLKIGDRFNKGALLDRGPYLHWYRAQEAVDDLCAAGFTIRAVASLSQLKAERMCLSMEELLREPLSGHFYCVCTK